MLCYMWRVLHTTYIKCKIMELHSRFLIYFIILLFCGTQYAVRTWQIMLKKEKNWECKTVTCFCFFSVISLFELDLLHVDGKIFFFTLNDCVFFCSTFKDSRQHRLEAWTEARLLYFESYVCSWSSQYQYSSELIISNF